MGDRFVRGWALGLVFLAATVPFLVVVTDLVARCRRRHIPLLPAVRAMRSRLLVALWVGALLWLGVAVGVLPDGTARPLPPNGPSATDWPVVGLAALAALALAGWLLARPRLRRVRQPSAEEELAGYTVALAGLAVIALATALASPLALLFVLPSLYAWLWLVQLHATGPRWAKDILFGLGFAGPVLALASTGDALRPRRGHAALRHRAGIGRIPPLDARRVGACVGGSRCATGRARGGALLAVRRRGRGSAAWAAARKRAPRRRGGSVQAKVGDGRARGDLALAAGDANECVGPRGTDDHVRLLTDDRLELDAAADDRARARTRVSRRSRRSGADSTPN